MIKGNKGNKRNESASLKLDIQKKFGKEFDSFLPEAVEVGILS